ncbi:MAG: PP2C family protein-serine/threonine phosphatase, partial [Thermoleophilaceae bacterium]
DFYDVFPLAADRWRLFLGDVCGKGPEAATLTSLPRYTLRTAAILKEDPAAALVDLNTALFLERTDELPMCTVVYGHIDRLADGGFALSLAVAGHPSPVIVRASSDVETVSSGGPLLGAIRDPAFETCGVVLGPGTQPSSTATACSTSTTPETA